MTRLNTLHPYPAMIDDDLAVELSSRFVKDGMKVLDPFCGTGRTLLAAAERGADCVGIDVNPLAVVVSRAKAGKICLKKLRRLLAEIPTKRQEGLAPFEFELEPGRKVKWFSRRGKKELCEIIFWLKALRLRKDEKILLAAILSATAREASFCRQDQWKLHRIPARKRSAFKKSPWSIFSRRLKSVLDELGRNSNLTANFSVIQGDSRDLEGLLPARNNRTDTFDLVITSPPYGDSHTTVGYGGISGICLGVIQHLGLRGISFEDRCGIDRLCLGGKSNNSSGLNYRKYWYGGKTNQGRSRVNRFLFDIEKSCEQITAVIRPGGRVVFVVARRTVSRYRVYLDSFLKSIMVERGFTLEEFSSRTIKRKNTPWVVDKSGRKSGTKSAKNRVVTMRTEYVLVFSHNTRGKAKV